MKKFKEWPAIVAKNLEITFQTTEVTIATKM